MSHGFDSANAESSRSDDFVFRTQNPGAESLPVLWYAERRLAHRGPTRVVCGHQIVIAR